MVGKNGYSKDAEYFIKGLLNKNRNERWSAKEAL